MANLTLLLNRAVAAYNAGQLAEAEQQCQKIIAAKRTFFDALHLLAVVQGRAGKREDALASYDRALKVRPDYAEAWSNRGNVLKAMQRPDEALASYERALKLRPDYPDGWYNRGNLLKDTGRLDEALASYDRALLLRPNFVEALSNRGNVLAQMRRLAEALDSCDRALKARPDFPDALINRAVILKGLHRLDEALASIERVLASRPDIAEAWSNRGAILHAMKRPNEALESYDRALVLRPNFAEALSNRGNVLREMNRFDEALASCEGALALRPDYAEAWSNRGVTLQEMRRLDDALASYDRAVASRPDYADAHINGAFCRLLTGDFKHGFAEYEWRWESEQLRGNERNFPQPLWRGQEAVAGKTILLHAEQGMGDTIQFCRYAPLLAERGARVILEVQKPLRELLSTLPGMAQVVSAGDPLPDIDMHCPLLSLPLAFETQSAAIPAATPYLSAPPQLLKDWENRLAPNGSPRVGLVWSGSTFLKNDRNRSIALSALLPLLDIDATFISLQKDVRADDAATLQGRADIRNVSDELKDFADTAALISHLDLVISVDTSVGHLAGALAKPVWMLLPYIPDWRWQLDRGDSPWYPTARLYRQDEARTWEGVIARAHGALQEFVRTLR